MKLKKYNLNVNINVTLPLSSSILTLLKTLFKHHPPTMENIGQLTEAEICVGEIFWYLEDMKALGSCSY